MFKDISPDTLVVRDFVMEKGKLHILIIDDESSVLKALVLLLSAMGYKVSSAISGREGLDILGEEPIECIICDLRMPEMDGLEVLKESKRLYPDIPFIMLSGHADSQDVEQAKELGMDYFLAKPSSPEDLKRAILAVI
ncbi:MAG: response regulator [Candidatus Dadabacteria bacterium]|nr:MAG: response regulator [Candidatus Dadabacteria bacterium]